MKRKIKRFIWETFVATVVVTFTVVILLTAAEMIANKTP